MSSAMWIGHCFRKQKDWLLSLAEEIGCGTDPDLVTHSSDGAQMVFIGKRKKCWVVYVNEIKIELWPNRYPHQMIDMTDPRCMERLEKWFHEDSA